VPDGADLITPTTSRFIVDSQRAPSAPGRGRRVSDFPSTTRDVMGVGPWISALVSLQKDGDLASAHPCLTSREALGSPPARVAIGRQPHAIGGRSNACDNPPGKTPYYHLNQSSLVIER
jgi:hypothetical protein